MHSRPFGKLLSSSGSKGTNNKDGTPKKPKEKASSEKRHLENIPPNTPRPTPPATDKSLSDSYFTAVKKKTTISDNDDSFNWTDDFGIPLPGFTLTPQADGNGEIKPLRKGNCRTCDKSFEAPVDVASKCDQCATFNRIEIPNPKKSDETKNLEEMKRLENIFEINLQGTKGAIETGVVRGLQQMKGIRAGSTAITTGENGSSFAPEIPRLRQTMLAPPDQYSRTRRRESAPDAPRPTPQSLRAGPITSARGSSRSNARGSTALDGSSRRSRNGSPLPSPIKILTSGAPPITLVGTNFTTSPQEITNHRTLQPRNNPFRETFKPVFDSIIESFHRQRLNISFSMFKQIPQSKSNSGPLSVDKTPVVKRNIRPVTPPTHISDLDHKNLMVGSVFDAVAHTTGVASLPYKKPLSKYDTQALELISKAPPNIDWDAVHQWYETFLAIRLPAKEKKEMEKAETIGVVPVTRNEATRSRIVEDLGFHMRGTVLDVVEKLLTSPQNAPASPEHVRYLLILLANPIHLKPEQYPVRVPRRSQSATLPILNNSNKRTQSQHNPIHGASETSWNTSKASRVLSLILGSIASLPAECHSSITKWLRRYPEDMFRAHVDMLLRFINERVSLRRGSSSKSKNASKSHKYNGMETNQRFMETLEVNIFHDDDRVPQDWQLRAACKVLQLFVVANNNFIGTRDMDQPLDKLKGVVRRKSGTTQLIPTQYFYVSQLDSEDKFDLRKDFNDWEKKTPGLHLSQFPFLLTLGTKIQILEFDSKRKMESKINDEFFDSLMHRTILVRHFDLNIRRDCIIEDSLQKISEATNSSEEEAKKKLKVTFRGEDGIDGGGLRKEWFLLLVKELLDPNVGMCNDFSKLVQGSN
jgi:E3 ubiquitin-protein ligase HECTD2